MKTRLLISLAMAALVLAGCKKKQTESSQTAAPTPAPSVAQAPTPEPSPVSTPVIPAASSFASPVSSASPVSVPESRPQFKSASANEFVETYDQFISDFKVAYEAMKHRDMTKYEAVILRSKELQSKAENLKNDLSPDEQKQLTDYLSHRAEELNEMIKTD